MFCGMDEERLKAKLRSIEALFAGAMTEGERDAAACARERILARLREVEREEPPVEYRFSIHDPWMRRAFLALLRRYGLTPYRLYRQRRTTVMVRAPRRFVDETLWPEFRQISDTLRDWLEEVTEQVISETIFADTSDAEERPEPGRLRA
jgi:hypothetical protein